jgi:hypothetical protein
LQLLQKFALSLCELRRRLHLYFYMQISAPVSIEHRHTLVLHPERGSGLRALGNLHHRFAIERGDGDFRAKSRLRERNGNGAIQVFAFAFEERVLFCVQHNVEIARRSTVNANLALARVEHARPFLDSRGNFNCDGALARDTALASTMRAGIDDQFARALAGATAARYREKALLIAYLPAARAGGAGDGCLARSRAAAFALVALFQSPHLHLLGDAKHGFLELESEILAQIGAALCARTAPPPEHVAKTEEVAEDIVKIIEHCGVESAVARTAGNSRVTKAIVARALLAVGENGIGFAAFLEAFLGRRIVGIAVRMVLQRELAIGALDLLVAGCAADAQNFVVIAFYVGGQNYLPFLTDLRFGMASHAHHRRTQQPVFQLVAALQLIDHMIVRDLVGVHHLDRLVQIRIEGFALRGHGLHP